MSTGNCDICAKWDSALEAGICNDCTHRLKLRDNALNPLTQRVHDIVSECRSVDLATVEHIICEMLYQAALDIRRNRAVPLEHIGVIKRITTPGNNVTIRLIPDPTLSEAKAS